MPRMDPPAAALADRSHWPNPGPNPSPNLSPSPNPNTNPRPELDPSFGVTCPGEPDPAQAQRWLDAWLSGCSESRAGLVIDPPGTPFQLRVWRLLREIPRGNPVTYGNLADRLGMPKAARAVGAACGANPVALWIPCHRVVGRSGRLHGYRWGSGRKLALLAWEARPAPGSPTGGSAGVPVATGDGLGP